MASARDTIRLAGVNVTGVVFSSRSSQTRHRCSVAKSRTPQKAPKDVLDVVERDLNYVEEFTGVPVMENLLQAHDQLVCMLNPTVAEERQKSLKIQVETLQQELEEAHEEVHRTEERLKGTISHLAELEHQVSNLSLDPKQAVPKRQRPHKKNRGLANDLKLSKGLREHWHPACFSAKLLDDMMIPIELYNEDWIVFRDENGIASCLVDECAHRACPLSAGSIEQGQVQCPYHGWTYDGAGECTKMPSTVQCKGVHIKSLPVIEMDGLVWVWTGEGEPSEVPECTKPPPGFEIHSELLIDVPVEHGLLLENLLDLAHAPFTHTSTFAKGWPIPDIVRFKAHRLLGGNWEPYPIDMSFEPPCMVLSTIGLARPGEVERGVRASMCEKHLHQLHVCLPSSEGRTTLLYRMSMDFMSWVQYVPGIQNFWSYIAGQVLSEDLVLVKGQQERLRAGGDVWAHPMPYDKLGVQYRQWRNAVGKGDREEQRSIERELGPMSAGEIFAVEEN